MVWGSIMEMETPIILSIIAIVVSAVTAVAGLGLTIQTNREANTLEKASRRTKALASLSEEQLALERVATECDSLALLINTYKQELTESIYEHLSSEISRIVKESRELLTDCEQRRREIAVTTKTLSPVEIESVIAKASHGRALAEAQLSRTHRSRDDTIRLYLSHG